MNYFGDIMPSLLEEDRLPVPVKSAPANVTGKDLSRLLVLHKLQRFQQ